MILHKISTKTIKIMVEAHRRDVKKFAFPLLWQSSVPHSTMRSLTFKGYKHCVGETSFF
jgi:hypothetical protein